MSLFDTSRSDSLAVDGNRSRPISFHGREKLSQVRTNEDVDRSSGGRLMVHRPRYNGNIFNSSPMKHFVVPLQTSEHSSRGRSKQQIDTVMSFPQGMKNEHRTRRQNVKRAAQTGKEKAKASERNQRGVKLDMRTTKRTEEKNPGMTKISFTGTSLRNQPITTHELLTKPALLAKRAEASRNEKKTSLGTMNGEPWSQSKLSPLPLRRTERDIAFLRRPRSRSHEEPNQSQRDRSVSEPPPNRTQTSSTAADQPRKTSKQGMATVIDARKTSLPKITIDEIFQSWKVTPTRVRSGTLNSDPMDHIRRDWALAHPVPNELSSYGKLKNCRYLRLPNSDEACVEHRSCSCNSCEHLEGLKKSPFMN